WRMVDYITYITKDEPNEPVFKSASFLPLVSPVPMAMINSTADEFVPESTAKRLFEIASQPKEQIFVEGGSHSFSGKNREFFVRLKETILWMEKQRAER